jgi:hypothetical protein
MLLIGENTTHLLKISGININCQDFTFRCAQDMRETNEASSHYALTASIAEV